jgi:hypothetical protein
MTTEIVVVRIELLHIEPLIWRRVAVPVTSTLETLHRIIQAVMGWLDKHLWDFAVGRDVFAMPRPDDAYWGHRVNDAAGIALADLIGREITSFDYTYDMGDDWGHRVIIEGVRPAEMARHTPSSWAVSIVVRPKTAVVSLVITSSSTPSLAPKRAREAAAKGKCWLGTAAITTRTT